VAADAGITPFAYTFWQSLLAGLLLLGYCAVRRSLPSTAMANLRAYGVIGTLAVGLPIALLTYAASRLPAGVLTLVLALSPPFTYGFGVLLRLDRLSWFGVLGILFGFAGVTVLVAPTASLPDPGASGWFMLSLLASVMFAGTNVLAAVLRPPAEDSVAMASGTLLGAAVVPLVLLVVIDHGGGFRGFSTNGWIALAGAVAMNSAVFVLYLEIVRTAGPTFFAQVNYIVIPAGIGWGVLLFGERHSVYVWFALALMFVGMAMIARKGVGAEGRWHDICARDRSYFSRRHKAVFKAD
jgi:drug/metabolite transporter (DMT)-like permease